MRKTFLMMALLAVCMQVLAQSRTVTGRITDAQGIGIASASVTAKGTTIGTSTQPDGTFSLSVPSNVTTLVISSVGYTTMEIAIDADNSASATLVLATKAVDEVIVVAYGTAKRNTFTGSASTIKSEDIAKQQVSNITKSLEGMVSGLKATSGSGQPGASAAVRIRGIGSVSASNTPLYVVDGVPYGGDLSAINPNDVESISVLKDAASAALYGARGSNGVIMITTKKGKGKQRFDLQARYGMNSRGIPEYDVIRDPGQFLEVYWESLKNEAKNRSVNPLSDADARLYASNNIISRSGGYNPYNVAPNLLIDPATGKMNPNASLVYYDDWEKEMFEPRPRQEYVGTLSGSSDKTRYYMSFGYLNDKGYVVKSDFTRVNGRLNIEQDVNNWLRVGFNASYANSKQNTTNESNSAFQNPFYFTRSIAPIYPVYLRNSQGEFMYDNNGNKLYDFGDGVMGTRQFAATENPRATLDYDIYSYNADNLSGRGFAEFKFMPELKLTVNYGIDVNNYDDIAFQTPLFGNAASVSGRGTVDRGRDFTTNINQLLNYNRAFGNHNLDVLLGHESYLLRSNFITGTKENFLIPDNPQLGNGVSIQDLQSSEHEYSVEGYFGQIKYDYLNKYLLSGSIRRDGSSRFAPEHRWGTFYSVGAGYVISQENFMKNISWINSLKIKASYGIRGNDALNNNYPYLDQFTIVNNNGQIGMTLTYKGTYDITWEKNRDLDIGTEFRLFNRLTGSIGYYKREIYDLLFNVPQAISTGVTTVPLNVGNMENWGWETELSFDIVRSKDFNINLSVNASTAKNKITKLHEINKENGITTGNFKLLEGKSIYEFYTWKYAGVDASTGRALYYKDEIGTDGKPTGKMLTTTVNSEATRYYTGKTAFNDVFGGGQLNVKYKSFDFSVLASYAIGGYVFDNNYQGLMYAGGGIISTWHKDIFNSWKNPGDVTNVPLVLENYQDANSPSDRWLTSASYFDIRNITIGYTLPTSLSSRVNLGATRFYVAADNVQMFSARKGLDPRQSITGTIGNVYSPIRTISVGLSTSIN
jgi:TonB-linked SusC/RagA family outer membrane protein